MNPQIFNSSAIILTAETPIQKYIEIREKAGPLITYHVSVNDHSS